MVSMPCLGDFYILSMDIYKCNNQLVCLPKKTVDYSI